MGLRYVSFPILHRISQIQDTHTCVLGHAIASGLPVDPPPQIAGAPFDSWSSSQVTMLNADGSLSGVWWDDSTSTWNELAPLNMGSGQAGSGAYGAIAQHHERRLYAVGNGTIQEFRWEASDPMTMIYVGKVTLATDLRD